MCIRLEELLGSFSSLIPLAKFWLTSPTLSTSYLLLPWSQDFTGTRVAVACHFPLLFWDLGCLRSTGKGWGTLLQYMGKEMAMLTWERVISLDVPMGFGASDMPQQCGKDSHYSCSHALRDAEDALG